MFAPIDILYIVLAFCILWISAALFWLIWQVATVLRNVNEGIGELRTSIIKIEKALTGIKYRFEHATTSIGGMVQGVGKVIDYAIEKKGKAKRGGDNSL